ncbi:hypothetical protein CHS0354_002332 [Potamilus streckersoni]|uniref:Uncharacterized protein n=1 Tax=Potamilus streckersoni TaxID=2493646 RepID=A0AAE0VZ06_9BIVA|nr:hypothetical protein CHS0354_002332 [Potamilus streckersoni]
MDKFMDEYVLGRNTNPTNRMQKDTEEMIQASYSLHTANKSFYGLFVNTDDKIDSHIPGDLQMEHIVRKIKKLAKNVGSKIMGTISRKSRALAGMSYVAGQYDHTAGVIVRAQMHKKKKTF